MEPLSPSRLSSGFDVCVRYSVAYSIDNRQRITAEIQVMPDAPFEQIQRGARRHVECGGKSVVLVNVLDS